ncbi:MAG: AsnC family transcriptional regulator [Prevotellaceae bacterium]|jgi:Lrp/AsnC family transcriptional regulator for asnA, asnC and gidA|nr:AsnC family transcriptional regulator [Prevotellaceae bacterium]
MSKQKLDSLDRKILKLISADARIPFLEVARECGVSGAAIHQRVQKLKRRGVIEGSEFLINNYRIGYQTCAYVGLKVTNTKNYFAVVEALRNISEVVECHYATGRFEMFVKIYAKDNRHLLQIIVDNIMQISGVTDTETFQISLEEIFRRQVSNFDSIEYRGDSEEDEVEEGNLVSMEDDFDI